MKALISLCIAITCFNLYAQAPIVVEAPVDHVFIPTGFDNNDKVEFVVSGKFPNPCFTRNKVSVKVAGDIIKVNITSLSKDDLRLTLCEPLMVPFTEVVNVGSLQGGEYQVVINEGGKFELKEEISIATSSSESVDDHLYTLVEYVDLGFTGGLSGDAMLVTQVLSPCLKLDRVEYISNKKDTLSVLPIMKKISNDCPERKSRVQIPIKFKPSEFTHEKMLLYVRSVDGKSVHSIIEK